MPTLRAPVTLAAAAGHGPQPAVDSKHALSYKLYRLSDHVTSVQSLLVSNHTRYTVFYLFSWGYAVVDAAAGALYVDAAAGALYVVAWP